MKTIILALCLSLITTLAHSQDKQYQLSSHILDVSKGAPAAGVTIQLQKQNKHSREWIFIDEKITDANGRINNFLPSEKDNTGIYKLTYFVDSYFQKNHVETFYPFIEVVFQIKDEKHYHVPITLSAFGYSTYRGN